MTKEKIKEIAENLDCGLRCFIHKETRTLISIPDTLNNPDMDTESWGEDMDEIDNNFSDYIEIEKMDSHESFKLMEDFIETLTDSRLQDKLVRALSRPKPFRNFKFEIDNSGLFRQMWFDFKNEQLIKLVEGQLSVHKL